MLDKANFTSVAARELLSIASLAAVAKRQGARRFERNRDFGKAISDLEKQGQKKPIVSALEAYIGNVDTLQSFIPIVYTPDRQPDATLEMLAGTNEPTA
jgi:hypothetical protein